MSSPLASATAGHRRRRHPRRPGVLTVFLLAVLLMTSCHGGPSRPGREFAPPGAAPTGDGKSPVPLGPTAADEPVELTVALAFPRGAEADRYVAELNDPGSPNYRHFLSPDQFGERFGLPESEVARVEAWLTSGGLEVVDRYPQRTALRARGGVAEVNALLEIALEDFRDPESGMRFHAPNGPGAVPEALRGAVAGITGLDSRPRFQPKLRRVQGQTTDLPGLTPSEVARAYDVTALQSAGYHGEGQFVAIISFDSVLDSDIAAWDQKVGIDALPIQHIPVRGGTTVGGGDDTAEVALDVEIIRGVAPRAQILNFEAPNNGRVGIGDVVDAILADGRARVVSLSWGNCDAEVPPQARLRDYRSLQAAAARGVTIFSASGDSGVYGCRRGAPADIRLSPDEISSSPFVVAVGGTFLTRRDDGSYFDEAGWEDPLTGTGTGGGLSLYDDRPAWQQGPGVKNSYSTGKRQFPDVAAPADSDSAHYIYVTVPGRSRELAVGGTSAAAPFWAGLTVLIQQLAQAQGAGPLGYLNPILYELAAKNPPNTIFHDVVRGGNLLHNATPGWDYATGLGTPIASRLAPAVLAYLREHPAA